jgi:hypothetical protein
MLATHARNLDNDCVGSSKLEDAPTNTNFLENGFEHLDQAKRSHCGAGIGPCIGVA